MNVYEILENYQMPILDDRVAFSILSLILSKGAINNENLKLSLKKMNLNFDNKLLITLFQSNLIAKNNNNDWIMTTLGKAILSKVGVAQIATIQILVKYIKDEDSIEWLKNAIEHENNLSNTIQVYTKFLVADYLMDKSKFKYIDEEIKSDYFYSLYCSSKNDFYVLDKQSFYMKYNYLNKSNSKVHNKTLSHIESCESYLIEFEDSDEKNEIEQLLSLMNFSVRTTAYVLNKVLDIGLKSLNKDTYFNEISKLKTNHYGYYKKSLSCMNSFSHAKNVDNIEKEVLKLIEEEFKKLNSIDLFLEHKNT